MLEKWKCAGQNLYAETLTFTFNYFTEEFISNFSLGMLHSHASLPLTFSLLLLLRGEARSWHQNALMVWFPTLSVFSWGKAQLKLTSGNSSTELDPVSSGAGFLLVTSKTAFSSLKICHGQLCSLPISVLSDNSFLSLFLPHRPIPFYSYFNNLDRRHFDFTSRAAALPLCCAARGASFLLSWLFFSSHTYTTM